MLSGKAAVLDFASWKGFLG